MSGHFSFCLFGYIKCNKEQKKVKTVKTKHLKILIVLIAFVAIMITVGFGIWYYFDNESQALIDAEKTNELIANEYLIYVSQNAEQNQNNETPGEVRPSDFEYDDNKLYGKYKEEWAWGHIDSVLEIPKISLRQSIYTGEPYQIQHDLANWMAVTARADYILGDTHYCIYMHNPRDGSIKISDAQEELTNQDYMIITNQKNVFMYYVAGVYPEWKDKCTVNLVDNMAMEHDKMFIFTCGRGDWQGRNLVIEGTLYNTYTLTDWNNHKETYIEQFKKDVGLIVEEKPVKKLNMKLQEIDKQIHVSLNTDDFTKAPNCQIGIFNEEGELVPDIENLFDYTGTDIVLPKLQEGLYYIGLYEAIEGYTVPVPYKVEIDVEQKTTTVISVDEEVYNEAQTELVMQTVAMISISLFLILFITIIVFSIVKKKSTNVMSDERK